MPYKYNPFTGTFDDTAPKNVVTTDDTGTVTSTMILNGTILNADINASAAISGTKISPDFGSQTIATTGVISAALGTAAAPSITFTGDINTGIYSPGADQFGISTGGTSRLIVDASGNVNIDSNTFYIDAANNRVGIGTTGPTENLTVFTGTSARFAVTNTNGSSAILLGNQGGSGANNPAIIEAANGNLYFGGGSSWSGGGTFNYTMTLLDGGNVGIGTTGPNTALSVVGGISGGVVTATSAIALPSVATNGYLRLIGEYQAGSGRGGTIQLGGRSFSDAGNVGAFLISANSTGNFNTTDITISTQTSFNNVISDIVFIGANGRVGLGTISPANQLQLSTDSAGKPSTSLWTIVSDERIKENIELADLDLCYEAIKAIPLKRYKWRDEIYTSEQVTDRSKLGWIAQDVEVVFPKAVGTHEFKYNQVFEEIIIPAVEEVLDDDGNVITPAQPERIEKGELISEDVIEDCRDLNADQLYAAMYGAVQKLIDKVEALEIKVSQLQSQ
jgi:hypothetical protein